MKRAIFYTTVSTLLLTCPTFAQSGDDLKPEIKSVTITKTVDNAPFDSYDAYYEVRVRRASKIKVTTEVDGNPKLHVDVFSGDRLITGVSDHLLKTSTVWLDVVAQNEYGETTYTLELSPYDPQSETSQTSPISQYVTQNGERIKSDYIFGNKAPITIYLKEGGTSGNGTWGYEYQRRDGVYEAFDSNAFSASKDSCTIYPEKIDFYSLDKTLYVPSSDRDCYHTRIVYNDGADTYYTYINFGGPASPAILTNVSIKCVWDPEYNSIFPESTATFDVISSGATYVLLAASSGGRFSRDENRGSDGIIVEQELQCSGRDTVHVIYEDVEWGELWSISVCNDFGGRYYDEWAFSTDYIDDPDILAKIEALRQGQETSMPDIDDDSMDIRQLSKGKLLGLTKEADCVSIYDMSGLCRVTERKCSVIDIGSLSQGIYIASIQWTASSGETKVRNFKLKK